MPSIHSTITMKSCPACSRLGDLTSTLCEGVIEGARKIAEISVCVLNQLGACARAISHHLRYAANTSMDAVKAHPQLFVSSMALAVFITALAYSNDKKGVEIHL